MIKQLNNLVTTIFSNKHLGILAVILLIGFVIRVININYNIPFNDEAIYVVLGRLGIFQWDWWSYNSSAWVAGYPYVYPPMTALAYMTGGIVGSRLLNVFFGVLTIEAIYLCTVHISEGERYKKYLAGLIAAAVIAGSAVGLYVSRLATMDMPSFYFLILCIVFLLIAEHPGRNRSKWYFFSSFFLVLSFCSKIVTGLYIPLVIFFSYLQVRNKTKQQKRLWVIYFLLPIVLCLSTYIIGNMYSLSIYASVQKTREAANIHEIISIFVDNSLYVWPLYFFGTIGMLVKRQWKLWLIFTISGSVILLFHLLFNRRYTLDKHTFLSVLSIAPIIGIGISNFVYILPSRLLRTMATCVVASVLLCYGYFSYIKAQSYNVQWDNASSMLTKLASTVHSGDKVLVEVGAAGILATYDKNFPTNTITFDWFKYKNLEGRPAYVAAIKDVYFDYIELEREGRPEDPQHKDMHRLIKENLNGNYKQIYAYKDSVIYKRAF